MFGHRLELVYQRKQQQLGYRRGRHDKNGTGLRGTSTSQYGLKATSVSGTAILAQTTSGPAAINASGGKNGYGLTTTGNFRC